MNKETTNIEKSNTPFKRSKSIFPLWGVILLMYSLLLFGIGHIAFTKQYFNKAEDMVGEFLEVKKKYKDNVEVDSTDQLIDTLIEESANASGDLQELASQSFNIILGALLAFLSASATVVFQKITDKPDPVENVEK